MTSGGRQCHSHGWPLSRHVHVTSSWPVGGVSVVSWHGAHAKTPDGAVPGGHSTVVCTLTAGSALLVWLVHAPSAKTKPSAHAQSHPAIHITLLVSGCAHGWQCEQLRRGLAVCMPGGHAKSQYSHAPLAALRTNDARHDRSHACAAQTSPGPSVPAHGSHWASAVAVHGATSRAPEHVEHAKHA